MFFVDLLFGMSHLRLLWSIFLVKVTEGRRPVRRFLKKTKKRKTEGRRKSPKGRTVWCVTERSVVVGVRKSERSEEP